MTDAGYVASGGIRLIRVLDTETSDLDPVTAGIMEYAHVDVALPDEGEERAWAETDSRMCYVEYTGPVSPEARSAHHIEDSCCAPGAPNCVPRERLIAELLSGEEPGAMMYAAHNAPFDRSFLPDLGLPWIDTLQCARHRWPDAPSYKNQTLRYWLGLEPRKNLLREEADVVLILGESEGRVIKKKGRALVSMQAHRALYDSAVTAALLRRLLLDHTPEELLRLSTTPLLLQICQFKKYKGVPWSEVPRDYLRWCSGTDMMKDDPNLAHTIRYYLGL